MPENWLPIYATVAFFVWVFGSLIRLINDSPHGTPEYVAHGARMQLLAVVWPLGLLWLVAWALCSLVVVLYRCIISTAKAAGWSSWLH